MEHDVEKSWPRQLLVGVGALLVVALLIGGVISAFAVGAAKVSGIDASRSATTDTPSLVVPSGSPTTDVEQPDDPAGASPSTPSADASAGGRPAGRKPAIRLRVQPTSVAANERINLTGVYARGAGARLQVQRFEGRWADFPVSVGVTGGAFATYVQTSRTGDARFRVVDKSSGRASNEVRVTVR